MNIMNQTSKRLDGNYRLSAVFILVASLLLAACGSGNSEGEKAGEIAIPVQGQIIAFTTFIESYGSIGSVASENRVNLVFETGGKVEEIMVEVGDHVRKDQALARIKSDVYETAYAQARSMFEKAQRDLASSQRLFEDNIISSDQFEMAKIGLDNARAGYSQARNMRDNTVLRAPFDGHIVIKNLNVGDVTGPSAAMSPPFVLADMNELKVVIPIPEARVGMVEAGQLAEFRFKSFPGKIFKGQVRRVGLAPKDMSNNYDVEVFISDPEHELRLGMVADVQIILERYEDVPVVPLRMIQDDGNVTYLYAIQGKRAKRIDVEVAGLNGTRVMVQGDLSPGDTLISRGQNDVSEGALLDVVEVLGN